MFLFTFQLANKIHFITPIISTAFRISLSANKHKNNREKIVLSLFSYLSQLFSSSNIRDLLLYVRTDKMVGMRNIHTPHSFTMLLFTWHDSRLT